MKKIIIASGVFFFPEERVIVRNNQNLKLHSSASYCFELLIARQGEIVNHEDFYQYAWRRFGMEVSTNALYQSISVIRKCLLACDIRQDVIRTIPRRGFMLSNAIVIEQSIITPEQQVSDKETVLGEEEHEDEKHNSVLECGSRDVLLKKLKKPNMKNEEESTEHIINNTQHSEAKANNTTSAISSVGEYIIRHTPSVRHLFIAGLTMLFLSFSIMTFSVYRQKIDFVKRLDLNGCEVYGNEKADNTLIARIAKNINTECNVRKNIFVTAFDNSERISVLQCKDVLSFFSVPNCISYYYIRGKW